MSETKDTPIHFSQAYNLTRVEKELEFFDLNLEYDSRLFIDPFLIKKSPNDEERLLFKRFGDFFRYTYDKSIDIEYNQEGRDNLKSLLHIQEPREVGLGYTENSNNGVGPVSFADKLFKFFVESTAKRLIKEENLYPDKEFNPETFKVFIDGIGPDSLSDISANLIMDYLIAYTQKQCKKHNIPLKRLPVQHNGFDFEAMEWIGGGYHDLPENLLKEGQAIILVPKHLLRATELEHDNIGTKVKGILKQDPELTKRFSSFLLKNVENISIEDVRVVFLNEETVFKKYIEVLGEQRSTPYDFEKDLLKILAIKSYESKFKNVELDGISNCDDLLERTFKFISLFNDQYSIADGWKDMWIEKRKGIWTPQREVVFGRAFRGMGYAFFDRFPTITFQPEVGTGVGPCDFQVIWGRYRIVIEIKKLENGTATGVPPIPAYLHGVSRQLPAYIYSSRASHAIYITGQHYTKRNRPRNHHDGRVEEIRVVLPQIQKDIQQKQLKFKTLHYFNIDFSSKPSASNV